MRARTLLLLVAALHLAVAPVAAAPSESNDECVAAETIRALPSTRIALLRTATLGPSDPDPSCTSTVGPTVWYRYTARAETSLELEASGISYHPVIAVYTGTCGALTEVACGGLDVVERKTRVVLPLAAGQSVLIAVAAGTDSPSGDPVLTARKSRPRYRLAKSMHEVVRSSDPSPLGGGHGEILAATPLGTRSLAYAFRQDGIFVETGGTLTTVALSGAPTPLGGTFAVFGRPAVAADGVYFWASIDGGPVAAAIFVFRNGALQALLKPGDPAPGGRVYATLRGSLAVSETGVLAFYARTNTPREDLLLAFDGSTTTVLAAMDTPSPCGPEFTSVDSDFTINRLGTQVAFVSRLQGGDKGVFVSEGGTLTDVVCEGDGTPLGGTHHQIGPRPAINDLGEVYFGTNGSFAGPALWTSSGGVVTALATEGMVLAGGGTISRISISQGMATNSAGDVVFAASLTGVGRSLVRRPHLAALPAALVADATSCPAGGVFDLIGDELGMAANGDVVFDASCDGTQGIFRKPVAGPPGSSALLGSATAVGSGFSFLSPRTDAGGRAAFRGSRTAIHRLDCKGEHCGAPQVVAVSGMPIANRPGQTLATLQPPTLAGTGKTVTAIGTVVGAGLHEAIVRMQEGRLDVVAAAGETLPGGVGIFESFALPDYLTFRTTPRAEIGKGVLAFHARIEEHPSANTGLFAATANGVVPIALGGDPAPNGGLFDEFSVPVVRGKSVLFHAATDFGFACLFGTKAPGRPLSAIVCEDDPLPAPFAGTIGGFEAAPSGAPNDLYVAVYGFGLDDSQCILRYQRGTASLVRCEGDPFIAGSVYGEFGQLATGGPHADVAGNGVLITRQDEVGRPTLVVTRQGTFVALATTAVTPAPESGGTILLSETAPPGMHDKAVVFAAHIDGGTASSAVIRAVLP